MGTREKFKKAESYYSPLTLCSVCLSVLFIVALIAITRFTRAGKQAIKNKNDKQSIKLKEGAKYAKKKYLPTPSKMHGVTFHYEVLSGFTICLLLVFQVLFKVLALPPGKSDKFALPPLEIDLQTHIFGNRISYDQNSKRSFTYYVTQFLRNLLYKLFHSVIDQIISR